MKMTPVRRSKGWFCDPCQADTQEERCGMCDEGPVVRHLFTVEDNSPRWPSDPPKTALCQTHYDYWCEILEVTDLVGVYDD